MDQNQPGWMTVLLVYLTWSIWLCYGYIRHYFNKFLPHRSTEEKGYAELTDDYSEFFTRYMYGRISDCWNRPICSTPGPWIDIVDREGTDLAGNLRFTGKIRRCLNLGSYNYLGFADKSSTCTEHVLQSIQNHSISTCSTRLTFGKSVVHRELEQLVARFVGKEDAIVFGMGYATNSTSLPSLVGKGGLIISDSINHASLVMGMRRSQAKVFTFKHNDPVHLEQVLRKAVIEGQPRTHRPWTKILIVVEGIYSMEGEIVRLPEIIAIKKKYKAYLYVDEAHSIGALGPKGGGVCDYWGVDPAEVDILMGTFTKSFGSAGGYIAGSRELIQFIALTSFASIYDTSMPVPSAQQIISSLKIIMGEDKSEDGRARLAKLKENSNYFRRKLLENGFIILGDSDSPVIPIMIYSPTKMAAFCRLCLQANLGCVVASYPALPLLASRARFCISAAHTIPELEQAINSLVKIGDLCLLRYHKNKAKFKALHPTQDLITINQQNIINDKNECERIDYPNHLNCSATSTNTCAFLNGEMHPDKITKNDTSVVVQNGKSNHHISANEFYDS